MKSRQINETLEHFLSQSVNMKTYATGALVKVSGLTFEARGCSAPLGSLCEIETSNGWAPAEVIGFNQDILYLMPVNEVQGIMPGAKVRPLDHEQWLCVGKSLIGRILDGNGSPMDGKGELKSPLYTSRCFQQINPLSRKKIDEPLDVGVKAINGLLTVGKGQRMGLFASSGVGKSVLLGMMTRGTKADIVVVCMVGERGREVKEFIDDSLGEEGLSRSIVITSPADTSPIMRLRSCDTATLIAEYFRDQGMDVLLLMDSLTRYSQAQREIALASGEPPATKGYPPSVFSKLPKLIERAGRGEEGKGTITAFYTVLIEGDVRLDPIADSARAILDGHIYLSKELAESGHYPAIDLEASISRLQPMVTTPRYQKLVRDIRMSRALYEKNRDLISIGAYVSGSDPRIDKAIKNYQIINDYLQQNMGDVFKIEESQKMLEDLSKRCRLGQDS
jgi:flagellum-specific ATP synthase